MQQYRQGDLATKADFAELRTEIAEIKAELKGEIAALKTDLLKWTIGAIGVQTVAILGALMSMMKIRAKSGFARERGGMAAGYPRLLASPLLAHQSPLLAVPIARLFGLALVVQLLSTGERDFDFCPALLVEINF